VAVWTEPPPPFTARLYCDGTCARTPNAGGPTKQAGAPNRRFSAGPEGSPRRAY
jgi:hypothetical protein